MEDPVKDFTVDCILGELAEINIALQAFMTAEQRDWYHEKVAERDVELDAIGGKEDAVRKRL